MGIFNTDYKICESSRDIPDEDHYAIIEFTSVTIPGDERSRTNPGHGYPEHTDHFSVYYAFKDKAAWEKDVKERTNSKYTRRDFVAVFVKRAKISTEVKVDVEI